MTTLLSLLPIHTYAKLLSILQLPHPSLKQLHKLAHQGRYNTATNRSEITPYHVSTGSNPYIDEESIAHYNGMALAGRYCEIAGDVTVALLDCEGRVCLVDVDGQIYSLVGGVQQLSHGHYLKTNGAIYGLYNMGSKAEGAAYITSGLTYVDLDGRLCNYEGVCVRTESSVVSVTHRDNHDYVLLANGKLQYATSTKASYTYFADLNTLGTLNLPSKVLAVYSSNAQRMPIICLDTGEQILADTSTGKLVLRQLS